MEKGITVRTGQVHVQRYWRAILEHMAVSLFSSPAGKCGIGGEKFTLKFAEGENRRFFDRYGSKGPIFC